MEFLLDTHTLLWAIQNSKHLPADIKSLINDSNNDVFISVISLWEIEIKHQKNPSLMPFDAKQVYNAIINSGFRMLNVQIEYLLNLGKVVQQNIHRDPFDHFLIVMASFEKMTLVTHDENIKKYQAIDILDY